MELLRLKRIVYLSAVQESVYRSEYRRNHYAMKEVLWASFELRHFH
jgi:hypothetical protein